MVAVGQGRREGVDMLSTAEVGPASGSCRFCGSDASRGRRGGLLCFWSADGRGRYGRRNPAGRGGLVRCRASWRMGRGSLCGDGDGLKKVGTPPPTRRRRPCLCKQLIVATLNINTYETKKFQGLFENYIVANNTPVEDAEGSSHVSFCLLMSSRIISRDTETVESVDCIIVDMVADNTCKVRKVLNILPVGSHTVLPPEEVLIDVSHICGSFIAIYSIMNYRSVSIVSFRSLNSIIRRIKVRNIFYGDISSVRITGLKLGDNRIIEVSGCIELTCILDHIDRSKGSTGHGTYSSFHYECCSTGSTESCGCILMESILIAISDIFSSRSCCKIFQCELINSCIEIIFWVLDGKFTT